MKFYNLLQASSQLIFFYPLAFPFPYKGKDVRMTIKTAYYPMQRVQRMPILTKKGLRAVNTPFMWPLLPGSGLFCKKNGTLSQMCIFFTTFARRKQLTPA